MYVQASNNLLYKNPTFYENDWMVRTDEMEGLIAYVKQKSQMTHHSAKRKLYKYLKENKIIGKLAGDVNYTVEIFGNGDIKKAYSWDLLLKKPIPVPIKHEGVTNSPPVHNDYYAWVLEFDTSDIYEYAKYDVYMPVLLSFLLNRTVWEYEYKRFRLICMRKLNKFIPKIGRIVNKIDLEEFESKYNKMILLKRT